MSRRNAATIRKLEADPYYGSELVAKLINHVMSDGKRSLAAGMVYRAFEEIKARLGQDPLEVFLRAVKNVAPHVEVKSRRVGGATYQVPVEVSQNRRITLALRWIHEFSKKRRGKTFTQKLAEELMEAAGESDGSEGRGGAVKKREDTHRMAEANKAFSHFRNL